MHDPCGPLTTGCSCRKTLKHYAQAKVGDFPLYIQDQKTLVQGCFGVLVDVTAFTDSSMSVLAPLLVSTCPVSLSSRQFGPVP